jgi:hypothetical protein
MEVSSGITIGLRLPDFVSTSGSILLLVYPAIIMPKLFIFLFHKDSYKFKRASSYRIEAQTQTLPLID